MINVIFVAETNQKNLMKKILLSIIAMAASFVTLSAQSIFSSSDNRAGLGIRLSYELSCPGDVKLNDLLKSEIYGNGSGINAGVVYHIPVIYNFYFEPGVTLAYNTYSLNKSLVDGALDQDPDLNGLTVTNASVRMWNLRLPIIGGYRFDVLPFLGINVFTGPEFQLGLSGKNHLKISSLNVSEGAYGDDGQLNRVDIKWRIGVGVTLNKHIYGAVSGAVGLCDQAKDDLKMHSNLFDITVGYNF